MAYQISGCKDPIVASSKLPQYSTHNVNYLANSGSRQPYQSLPWNTNYLPLSLANINYNLGGYNMGCCGGFNTQMSFFPMLRGGCGGNTGVTNFYMPSYSCGSGNQTLFNLNFGGSACCGGYGGYMGGYSPLMMGLTGGYMPFGMSGSYSNGFTNMSYSDKGYAMTNPFGSYVASYGGGKSHSYNLGALGSYASGSGGRAMNILGLYSQTRSDGNTSRDFSGLINLGLGMLLA